MHDPTVPVPLRGARRLPADDHARGARRPQEGHERGRAQRAPGQPRARRAGLRAAQLDPKDGIPLAKTGHREAGGKLFFQTTLLDVKLPAGLPQGKADNQILGVVQGAARAAARSATSCWCPRTSTCASRRARWACRPRTTSTTRRSKTATCSTPACCRCRPTSGSATARRWRAGSQGGHTFYRITGPLVPALMINQFVYLETPGAAPLYARVTEITGKTAVLKTLKDYTHEKNAVWGVTARNREQNFALNLLMDPECDFITLTGTAGTGKTLMTLAAGPEPGARRPPLQRDHRHPRHRAGGRGHRLPARHRGREDGPVDGRARRQPRGAGARRRAAPANGAAPPPTTWCAARSRSRA